MMWVLKCGVYEDDFGDWVWKVSMNDILLEGSQGDDDAVDV